MNFSRVRIPTQLKCFSSAGTVRKLISQKASFHTSNPMLSSMKNIPMRVNQYYFHSKGLMRLASAAALPNASPKSRPYPVTKGVENPTSKAVESSSSLTRFSSIAREDIHQETTQKPLLSLAHNPTIPDYLRKYYWWAYISPTMIRILDHQFLVDIVLWGNFSRLRDAAIAKLQADDGLIHGKTLQMSCVYANLSEAVMKQLSPDSSLDVIDVVPAQLENLRRKLMDTNSSKVDQVALTCYDVVDLHDVPDESYDQVLLFFLLHETPDDVRRQALSEAFRVLKSKGGKLVLIDYHKPTSPLWQGIMSTMYRIYEPFAQDLWMSDLSAWMPQTSKNIEKHTFFGGLYQRVVVMK